MSDAASRRIRNLGIMAHVDAGKTTLTEGLLFHAGQLREAGSVDKGTSRSDVMDVERRRGISVRASVLAFDWEGVRVHLIDTPGHVDFAAEVERALRALDAVVLVICAAEGIQAHTETIWRACETLGLPVVVFLNKIDRVGADAAAVVTALHDEWGVEPVWLNRPRREGATDADVVPVSGAEREAVIEAVAAQDDAVLAAYLEGTPPSDADLDRVLAAAVAGRSLVPVLCGSAKSGAGVDALLSLLVRAVPEARTDAEAPASALVFRLDHDERLGRIAGVRLFAGRLRTRDRVANATAGREERITQIRRLEVDRLTDAGQLQAGDIGFLCGLPEVRIGDVLGDPAPVPGDVSLTQPLLTVRVTAADPAQETPLTEAMEQLASEDPHLDVRFYPQERELHARIMGAVQTEILTEVLRDRFGLQAEFGAPTVVYQETPSAAGFGDEAYTMPKPCWAIVKFRIDPAPRGSGVSYRSEVDLSDIAQRYQNEIAAQIEPALRLGIKGWEVTDLEVTLVEGCHHLLHSRPGDFKLATNMALMKAQQATGTTLLEPYVAFRARGPEGIVGKVSSDVAQMRGTFEAPHVADGSFELRGRVPLATSMDYAIRLGSLSGGRGAWTSRFDGYEACTDELGVIRDYKGISPLDRAKYILWWRGAITDSHKG